MKLVVLLIFCLSSGKILAQQLSGYVLDEETQKPIPGATVRAGLRVMSTAENGYFSFANINSGDTIRITHLSYKAYNFSGKIETGMRFFLKKNITALASVVVRANRNYKTDSLQLRNSFSSVFSYKKPGLKDIFIPKSETSYNGIGNSGHSFNSVVSINLLQVLALTSKNKTPVAKLQTRLLNDEEETYINRRFSKEKVSQVTSLKGDSLQTFINRFKPSVYRIKEMTEYELIQYIRKMYLFFMKMDNSGRLSAQ